VIKLGPRSPAGGAIAKANARRALAVLCLVRCANGAVAADLPGSALTNEELISQLQTAELVTGGRSQNPEPPPRLLPLGAPLNIGPRKNPIYVEAPDLPELVRRGVAALPALLDHLSDARPTGIVFALAPRTGTGRVVVSGTDYDSRYPAADRQPAGVNTKEAVPLGGDGTYCVKVGDLCYVAVGEIVDRQLHVVGWHGGGGGWPAGAGIGAKISAIDSPVERPALAAAARADWGGVTAKDHEQSLLDWLAPSEDGVQVDLEAVDRLLLYYPASGLREVEGILRHNRHAWAKEALVKELAPFRTPELDAELYRAYEEAVAAQVADLKTQPPGTWDPGVESLGSTLPLDCARLLVHQGHDDEFRAFAQERRRRIKEADEHPAPRPPPPAGIPGFVVPDTLRIVHNYELESCEALLKHLDEPVGPSPSPGATSDAMPPATPGARVTIESIEPAGGVYAPLVIHFGLSNVAIFRVRAARVVVTRARDDAGVLLEPSIEPRFSYVSVGRISDDILTALPPPSLSVSLTSPARPAKRLATLEGWLEAVVPDRDPEAVATVANVPSSAGAPSDTPAFQRAGLTVTLFDKGTCEKYRREKGAVFLDPRTPAVYGIPVPGSPGGADITAQDLAVLVGDEQGRLISTEFRTKDGGPLRYNHDGWAHYGSLPGTRLDLYHFDTPVPADAEMVCLLVTPGALVVAPFRFTGLALP